MKSALNSNDLSLRRRYSPLLMRDTVASDKPMIPERAQFVRPSLCAARIVALVSAAFSAAGRNSVTGIIASSS